MKRFLLVGLGIFAAVQLAGCTRWVVRKSVIYEPRVDQGDSGNRGYIFGKGIPSRQEPAFTERKTYRVEVELPDLPNLNKKGKADFSEQSFASEKKNALKFNSGKNTLSVKDSSDAVALKGDPAMNFTSRKKSLSVEMENEAVKPVVKSSTGAIAYKVEKGDTLQKISQKFYGTTKKWLLLYEANKNVLKGPDKVFPGQVLTIPEVAVN